MTPHAHDRSGFEYGDLLSRNDLELLVAIGALYRAVLPGKRKPRLPVVIEDCRHPGRTIVTGGAGRDSVGSFELSEMELLVASFASARGRLEIHFLEWDFRARWLVALNARGGAMPAD